MSLPLIYAGLVMQPGLQSGLHAPALDCSLLDKTKHHVLDREADQNDGKQTGKHFRNVKLILAFEDVPAETALARRHAEHQLSRDQCSPGEGPADLEAGENAWKRRGDENSRYEAQAG